MTPNIGKGGFSSLRKKDVLRSSSEKRYRDTILLINILKMSLAVKQIQDNIYYYHYIIYQCYTTGRANFFNIEKEYLRIINSVFKQ